MKYSCWAVLILLFFMNNTKASSQKIDYRDIRDKNMSLTCGPGIDSSDVYGSMRRLEALDTNLIEKNIHMYYEDLGTCYWMAQGKPGADYLQKSVEANQHALYHKPRSTKAMWNIAFSYAKQNDCGKAKHYLSLYEKHTPKKYLNEDHDKEVAQILAGCE